MAGDLVRSYGYMVDIGVVYVTYMWRICAYMCRICVVYVRICGYMYVYVTIWSIYVYMVYMYVYDDYRSITLFLICSALPK